MAKIDAIIKKKLNLNFKPEQFYVTIMKLHQNNYFF